MKKHILLFTTAAIILSISSGLVAAKKQIKLEGRPSRGVPIFFVVSAVGPTQSVASDEATNLCNEKRPDGTSPCTIHFCNSLSLRPGWSCDARTRIQ